MGRFAGNSYTLGWGGGGVGGGWVTMNRQKYVVLMLTNNYVARDTVKQYC